ncbi:hypothetical protein [Streptomyces sp. Da 82-17]|uniref:hypothetical protein n=1 Tax=Streptomyces sp. Da 82-17 TaxID=3377116 RepID=UPI0038D50723
MPRNPRPQAAQPTAPGTRQPDLSTQLEVLAWAVAGVTAWVLLYLTLKQGSFQWLGVLNVLTAFFGLFASLNARRLARPTLAHAGRIAGATTLVALVAALALAG